MHRALFLALFALALAPFATAQITLTNRIGPGTITLTQHTWYQHQYGTTGSSLYTCTYGFNSYSQVGLSINLSSNCLWEGTPNVAGSYPNISICAAGVRTGHIGNRTFLRHR